MSRELQPGQEAPDFRLVSASGTSVGLSDLRGQWVVLYFIREFGCRVCRGHSLQFGRLYPQFQKAGAEVLVVIPGSQQQAGSYAEGLHLSFPILADPEREVYLRYGLTRMMTLLQRSEMFILDREGRIRFAQGHGLPTRLPDVPEVLVALRDISSP